MMAGVEMNMTIAEYGFKHDSGLNLGSTIKTLANNHYESDDLSAKIKAVSAAASDARMAGAPLPVMSSAGSGNHGITAIIPVAITGKHLNKNREDIARAIAYSHLTTSFIKSRMGRLSPVCGCSVAAAVRELQPGWFVSWVGDDEASIKAIEIVLGKSRRYALRRSQGDVFTQSCHRRNRIVLRRDPFNEGEHPQRKPGSYRQYDRKKRSRTLLR